MSLCLTEGDLIQLGAVIGHSLCCVSPSTAARTALHQVCTEDLNVARNVSDMLDLRHIEMVSHVRAQTANDIAKEARLHAQSSTGESLVGWAWALLTDIRPEVVTLGQHLMADAYVRGLQVLARYSS